ncbi:MAG: hypothetical protein Q8K85_13740 [Hyphomicrobium sp.]|nr:hypothetical protein [Hyphomicrobium sp.]
MIAAALLVPVNALTAASKSPKLAKCDGKQRRPANPYGSILPTVDPQAGTSTPAASASGRSGVDVFSDAAPVPPTPVKPGAKPEQIPPISSSTPPSPYRSC